MFHKMSAKATRKGQKPRLDPDVEEMRSQHVGIYEMRLVSLVTSLSFEVLKSLDDDVGQIDSDIDSSTAPLSSLKRTTIKDLRMNESVKGVYLTLRTLEHAYVAFTLVTIVEDHVGNVVVFNYRNSAADLDSDPEYILPMSVEFILKEPHIQLTQEGKCTLRCDSPTDIILLYRGHELSTYVENNKYKYSPNVYMQNRFHDCPVLETAEEWNERGDRLFKSDFFRAATTHYLHAMKKAKTLENEKLLRIIELNLSASYYHSDCYEASLEFAEKVLEHEPENEKALSWAGKSSYSLRRYKDAEKFFQTLCSSHPGDADAEKELKACRDRINEEENGDFSMYKMFLNRSLKPHEPVQCADYIGPLKVVEIPGKGRGVVATKDIEAGTLLVVSKAFAFASRHRKSLPATINVDPTVKIGNLQKLIAKIAHAIANNPKTCGPLVYDLCDGKRQPLPPKIFCDPQTKTEPIADVEKIDNIVKTNCFGAYNASNLRFFPGKDDLKVCCFEGDGLFTFPSMFNHSCWPNALWLIFGDVMFIRAITFVSAGEEVCLPYIHWLKDLPVRQKFLKARGFRCRCQLCRHQEAEMKLSRAMVSQRVNISNKFENHVAIITLHRAITDDDALSLQNLIKEYEATFKHGPDSIILSCELNMKLGRLFSASSMHREAIECYISALKTFGIDQETVDKLLEEDLFLMPRCSDLPLIPKKARIEQLTLDLIEFIIVEYQSLNEREIGTKWINVLVVLEKVLSGGDFNVVKLKYLPTKRW